MNPDHVVCPACGKEDLHRGVRCFHCGEILHGARAQLEAPAGQTEGHGPPALPLTTCGNRGEATSRKKHDVDVSPRLSLALLVVGVLVFVSLFRVYYSERMGFRVVFKELPSFKDTVVNLDDLFEMPRIAVATMHPEVKRQLQRMGVMETDEQAKERIRREVEEETSKQMERMQRQLPSYPSQWEGD